MRLRFNFEPYQWFTICILLVITFASFFSFILGQPVGRHLTTILGLLVLYLFLTYVFDRLKSPKISLFFQSLLTINILLSLYCVLAFLAFDVIPFNGDIILDDLDRLIFLGASPVLFAERFVSPATLQIFSFFYAVFIPYLYFSIFISSLGRPAAERKIFITAFAMTYSISFLGYLFVPARGPIVLYDSLFTAPLVNGGFFHQMIIDAIDRCGGPHGAFPSLHVGASWFICYFDLKFNRLRGLLYLPIVLFISIATVLLRYHYFVDLIAGFVIATVAVNTALKINPNMSDQHSGVGSVFHSRDFLPQFWRFILKIFYKDIQVFGHTPLKQDTPFLVVSNHVNALIDPFVISAGLDRPLKFTAKATLLKNPYLKFIIRFLGAITFHRPQDDKAFESRRKNIEAIEECARVMESGNDLCIFPEGRSHNDPGMIPFMPGAAHIALTYCKKYAQGPALKILPVGLFYEKKYQFRSRVVVNIGTPIDVFEWKGQNPRSRSSDLTQVIEEAVKALTVNFERTRDLVLVSWAADLYQGHQMQPLPLGYHDPIRDEYLTVVQTFARNFYEKKDLPEVRVLEQKVYHLRKQMNRLGISLHELYLPLHWGKAAFFIFRECELLFFGLPLFMIGYCLHYPALYALRMIANILSTERDHWATNYVITGFGIFFVYYVVIAVLLMMISPWYILMIFVFMFCGYFTVLYSGRAVVSLKRVRTFCVFTRQEKLRQSFMDEADHIYQSIIQIRDR
ncbi:MAG: phosphatase PAP2 family protein [Candidatus Omnitrophica bacterium]|nr:phosphatase PAP2 family protein [Candidatus Omnitrophota bacterium]